MDGKLAHSLCELLDESGFYPDDYLVARAIDRIKGLQADLAKRQAELDQANRELAHFETENLRLREQLVDTPKPPPNPDLDRIKRERAEARAALERLRERCWSLGSDPDSIVDIAIKELTRLRKIEAEKQPEPPKKAVYEWKEFPDMLPTHWFLYRGTRPVGNIRPKSENDIFQWEATRESNPFVRGTAATLPLAKIAAEAVVRAYYGDAA